MTYDTESRNDEKPSLPQPFHVLFKKAMSRGVHFSVDTTCTVLEVSEGAEGGEEEIEHHSGPTHGATSSYTKSSRNLHSVLTPPLKLSTKPAVASQPSGAGSDAFTPPGSPTREGLSRDPSVYQLYKSARYSFNGSLEPRRDPKALPFPIRRVASMMIPAQDWEVGVGVGGSAEAGGAALAEATMRNLAGEESMVPQHIASREEKAVAAASAAAAPAIGASNGAAESLTVVTSAPGKVILFGEHAVVYGKTAVAAAVSDLRIVATVKATAEPMLYLSLPNLISADGFPLVFSRPSKDVAEYFAHALDLASGASPAPPTPDHLALISKYLGDACSAENQKALLPLLFLILALAPDIFLGKAGPTARGLSATLFTSTLPVGAGLGSSAAFCVAICAALLRLAKLVRAPEGEVNGAGAASESGAAAGKNSWGSSEGAGEGEGEGRRPSVTELEEINAWAYAGETVLHGTPSGLDNTVSCYGGAIRFMKGMGGAGNVTEPIAGFPPLPILLTNTLVPKNTRALVAGVRCLREAHPAPTAAVFDAIGAVADEFLERAATATAAEGGAGTGLTAEAVGELAEMNQQLLCALGVGHPALERVCIVGKTYGCKSKLTGAGGGGCALTILGADISGRKEALVKDLTAGEGFRCYESSLGGPGVLYHDGGMSPNALLQGDGGGSVDAGGGVDGGGGGDGGQQEKERRWEGGRESRAGITATTSVVVAVAAVVAAAAIVAMAFGQRQSSRGRGYYF